MRTDVKLYGIKAQSSLVQGCEVESYAPSLTDANIQEVRELSNMLDNTPWEFEASSRDVSGATTVNIAGTVLISANR